jgi:hypothetical protein
MCSCYNFSFPYHERLRLSRYTKGKKFQNEINMSRMLTNKKSRSTFRTPAFQFNLSQTLLLRISSFNWISSVLKGNITT